MAYNRPFTLSKFEVIDAMNEFKDEPIEHQLTYFMGLFKVVLGIEKNNPHLLRNRQELLVHCDALERHLNLDGITKYGRKKK